MRKINVQSLLENIYYFQVRRKEPAGLFGLFTKTVTGSDTVRFDREILHSVPHIGFTYYDGRSAKRETIYIPESILEEKLSNAEQLQDGLKIYVEWSEKLEDDRTNRRPFLERPTAICRTLELKFDQDESLKEIQIFELVNFCRQEIFVAKVLMSRERPAPGSDVYP